MTRAILAALALSPAAFAQDMPDAWIAFQPAAQATKDIKAGGDRPWRISFTPGAEYALAADLKATTGDVSIARAGAALGVDAPIGEMSSLAVSFGWQHSWYTWDKATSLGGVAAPWDDTDELDLGVRFSSRIDEKWSWFAGVGANSSGEKGADFSDTLTFGGGGGVRYRASDTLAFTAGLIVRSQLEDSASVIPIIGVDWKFAEHWALTTEYRTSIFPRPGIFLTYSPCDTLDLALGASYETHVFRLSDRDTPIDGIARERRIPVELSASWKLSPHATLAASAGVVVWQRFRLDTSDGTLIGQNEADPTGIFGLSLKMAY